MNNHGGSTGATLNGNPAEKIPPNSCYPLEAQAIEHQRLQQRQTNYSNFGKFHFSSQSQRGREMSFVFNEISAMAILGNC